MLCIYKSVTAESLLPGKLPLTRVTFRIWHLLMRRLVCGVFLSLIQETLVGSRRTQYLAGGVPLSFPYYLGKVSLCYREA